MLCVHYQLDDVAGGHEWKLLWYDVLKFYKVPHALKRFVIADNFKLKQALILHSFYAEISVYEAKTGRCIGRVLSEK